MTALNFTADAATDQLAIVAHGLNTGDGAATALVGPALGGLSESADYWIIRQDADHVKLATSQANALVGTAVDVTSNISGVLGIGLPYRRARTYAPGSQLKSADLNALQDQIIAMGPAAVRSQTFAPAGYGTGGTYQGDHVNLGTGGGTFWSVTIPMPVGARLRKLTIDGVGNAADDVTIAAVKTKRNNSTALIAPVTWTNVPAANGTQVLDVDETAADSKFAIGEQLAIVFDATTGSNISIYGITVEWDFVA